MKYVAVFYVPDNWEPSRFNAEARVTFEFPRNYPSGENFKVMRVELKKLPERIPAEWDTPQAEGFNACLDLLESG